MPQCWVGDDIEGTKMMKRLSYWTTWMSLVAVLLGSQALMGCGAITLMPPPVPTNSSKNGETKGTVPTPPKASSWVITSGGASFSKVTHTSKDGAGNFYLTGYFQNFMALGAVQVRSRFGMSLFVAKLNPQGKTVWVRRISVERKEGTVGNSYDVMPLSLAVNQQGEVALAAQLRGDKMALDNGTLLVQKNVSVYVVRLSSQGEWRWVKSSEPSDMYDVKALTLSESGVVTVVGNFAGTLKWGSKTLPGTVGRTFNDSYVCQFNAEGQVAFLRSLNVKPFFLRVSSAVSLSGGRVMVVGNYSGSWQLERWTLPATEGRGSSNVGLLTLDRQGLLVAVNSIQGRYPSVSFAHSDSKDNVALLGQFSGRVKFGKLNLETAVNGAALFVAKIASNGSFTWVKGVYPQSSVYLHNSHSALSMNEQGEVVLGAAFTKPLKMGRFVVQGNPSWSPSSSYPRYTFLARLSDSGEFLSAKAVGSEMSLVGVYGSAGSTVTVGNCVTSCRWFSKTIDNKETASFHVSSVQQDSAPTWQTSSQGLPTTVLQSAQVDAEGRSYLLGKLGQNWTYQAKQANGPADVVSLTQLDVKGQVQWSFPLDKLYSPIVFTDSKGNSYVTGMTSGKSFEWGSKTITPGMYRDILVSKLSSEGKVVWVKLLKDTERMNRRRMSNQVNAIVADPAGYVSVLGSISSSQLSFDGKALEVGTFEYQSKSLLMRLKPDGSLGWVKVFGGEAMSSSMGLNTNAKGELFVRGKFYGKMSLEGVGTLESKQHYDTYIAKFSSDGKARWAFHRPSDRCEYLQGLALDSGSLVVSGYCQGTASFDPTVYPKNSTHRRSFVARLNAEGSLEWVKMTKSKVIERLHLAQDGQGRVYTLGHFFDSAELGGKSFKAKGGMDLLLLRWTAKGEVERSWQWGGSLRDTANSLAFWGKKAILGGTYRSEFQIGASKLSSQGGEHAFLTQIELLD